jgi:hypothetical protein
MEIHPGTSALEIIVSEGYWWPTLRQDVQKDTSEWNTCLQIKQPKPELNSLLGQTTSQGNPHLRHWSMDFVQFLTSQQF